MKKNVIMLVIDSLAYKYLNGEFAQKVSAPYLTELQSKYISATNMYSQAPFTEAAVMNLWCGQRTLDNGGYLSRINNAKVNIFKLMHDSGYHVFNNSIQPYCFTDCLFNGVDSPYITEIIDVKGMKSYRLDYYAKLYNGKSLNGRDYDFLIELMDDFFDSYIRIVGELKRGSDLTVNIYKFITNKDYDTALNKAAIEKNKYENDKNQYINQLLSGNNRAVYELSSFPQESKVSDETREYYTAKTCVLFKKLNKLYKKCNRKNNKCASMIPSIKRIFKSPSKTTVRDMLIALYANISRIQIMNLKARTGKNYDKIKNSGSIYTKINHFLNWEAQYNEPKPYFAYIHADDIHYPEVFLTYDTDDKNMLEREIESANEVLNNVPKDYKGNLVYELGLRYIDDKIKYLFDELRARGRAEDTVVIITSDHGYSYYNSPVRDNFVKNFYLENYHVPFIVVGAERPAYRITKRCQSFDIAASVCDLCGLNPPAGCVSNSVFSDLERPFTTLEYMGGGCPDISRRPIKYAVFDDELFVSAQAACQNDITPSDIMQIFDMRNDPLQLRPLQFKNLLNKDKALQLLGVIQERHGEIRDNLKGEEYDS